MSDGKDNESLARAAAEVVTQGASTVKTAIRRGGMLLMPLIVVLVALTAVIALAVAGQPPWLVALIALVFGLGTIGLAFFLAYKTFQQNKPELLAGAAETLEAMRLNIYGARHAPLTEGAPVPVVAEAIRPMLDKVQVEPGSRLLLAPDADLPVAEANPAKSKGGA